MIIAEKNNNRNKGFTLIELILGVSIFSVVMTVVYSTFWGGIRLSERSQQQGEVYREVRWAFDLIARDLESSVTYDFGNSYEGRNVFEGEQSKMTFIIATDEGLKFVSYYLISPESRTIYEVVIGNTYDKNVRVTNQENESKRVNYLVRDERGFVDYLNNKTTEQDEYEIIAMNVSESGLRFQYAYRIDEEDPTIEWKSQWNDTAVPKGVRMEMEFIQPKTEHLIILSRKIFIPHGIWMHKDEAGKI